MSRMIDKVLTKRLGGTRELIDLENRTATFVFSTDSVDRAGDIIDQATWNLERYKANPVFLWAHKSRDLPIGLTVDLKITKKKLIGVVKFASEEENPFAEMCWNLVKGGYLSAVSVGFIPHKYESYDNGDGNRGYKLYDCELLECSLVPIPCNQDALLGAKDIVDMGKLRHAYTETVGSYDDSLAGVFGKSEIEAVIAKSFGIENEPAIDSQGTKGDQSSVVPSTLDGQEVYDSDRELIGIMVGGALKMTRTYQSKIAAKNLAAITQQAPAQAGATIEKKTSGEIHSNFFLRRAKANARKRRVLVGA